MAALNADLTCLDCLRQHKETDSSFWGEGLCPNCGHTQFLVVAASVDGNYRSDGVLTYLRCISCRRGVVVNGGVMSPGATPLQPVDGCPDDVETAWAEARADLGAGSMTSAVMMCRKLLFHIAVEKGLPAQNDKGRAPTFEACLDQLRSQGLLTPPLEPWVNNIKDVGNQANHELEPIRREDALRVATFTRQLLVTTYEMPHKMKAVNGGE